MTLKAGADLPFLREEDDDSSRQGKQQTIHVDINAGDQVQGRSSSWSEKFEVYLAWGVVVSYTLVLVMASVHAIQGVWTTVPLLLAMLSILALLGLVWRREQLRLPIYAAALETCAVVVAAFVYSCVIWFK